MRIVSVTHNNRRKGFEVETEAGRYWFPFGMLENPPSREDPILEVYIDQELGSEGFTYLLKSGTEDTVHVEQVLEYSQDPEYLRHLILYKLTLEAQQRVEASRLSKREIIRRLGTSASQFYRLLDQTNYSKSVDRMLALLHVLDCEVEVVVRERAG